MDGDVLTISATEFKATCLSIFDALENRTVSKVVVTRRGKPVAELTAPEAPSPRSIYGAHKGSVWIAPGLDLTEPTLDEPTDAELGILHN